MDYTLAVHIAERPHYRQHKLNKRLRVKAAVVRHIILKRFSVKILHDDIGGAVLLKVIVHVNNTLFIRESGDILRLFQKTLLAFFEKVFSSLRDKHGFGHRSGSVDRSRREIFLDGYTL